MRTIAKIDFKDRGYISLGLDGKWAASNNDLSTLASIANNLTRMYNYSPSHGSFGYKLASELSQKLHGTFIPIENVKSNKIDKEVIF